MAPSTNAPSILVLPLPVGDVSGCTHAWRTYTRAADAWVPVPTTVLACCLCGAR